MPSNHFDFEKTLHHRSGAAPLPQPPPARSLHFLALCPPVWEILDPPLMLH